MNLSTRARRLLLVTAAILPATVWAEPVDTAAMHWPRRLWEYFGLVGTLSAAAWIGGLLLAAWFARRPRTRMPGLILGLCLAGVGFGLGEWNASRIAGMEVDLKYEQELEAKRVLDEQRQKALVNAKAEMTDPTTYKRRFAEDTAADWLDAAGKAKDEAPGTSSEERAAAGYDKEANRELGGEATGVKDDKKLTLADVGEAPVEGDKAGQPGVTPGRDEEPLYRRGGPRQRRADAKDSKLGELVETADNEAVGGGRLYSRDATNEAARWGMVSRHAAQVLVVVFLVLIVWRYLRVFNQTFDFLFPLPLGGPWLDALTRKRHSVLISRQTRRTVGTYLHRLVRKGETFIYFGPEDPQPAAYLSRFLQVAIGGTMDRALGRVAAWLYAPEPSAGGAAGAGGWLTAWFPRLVHTWEIAWMAARRWLRRALARAPFLLLLTLALLIPIPLFFNYYDPIKIYWYGLGLAGVLLPLLFIEAPWLDTIFVRKVHFDWQAQPKSTDYVFESAWFGRLCFTVTDPELAHAMLRDFGRFLALRVMTGARAAHTLNIVWDYEDPPEERFLFELAAHCRKTNCRLLVIAPSARAMYFADGIFEERFFDPLPLPPPLSVTLLSGFVGFGGGARLKEAPPARPAKADSKRLPAGAGKAKAPPKPAAKPEKPAASAKPAAPALGPRPVAVAPPPAPREAEKPVPKPEAKKPAQPPAKPAPREPVKPAPAKTVTKAPTPTMVPGKPSPSVSPKPGVTSVKPGVIPGRDKRLPPGLMKKRPGKPLK